VSGDWALAAPRESLRAIAALRQTPGLLVCEAGGELWLRGPALDEATAAALQLIPGGSHYTILPDNQLVPAGKLVPLGRLPEGPWQPLGTWLALELPPVRAELG
jgi:hypothetical protein